MNLLGDYAQGQMEMNTILACPLPYTPIHNHNNLLLYFNINVYLLMFSYIAAALYTTVFSHYIVKWLVVLDLQ